MSHPALEWALDVTEGSRLPPSARLLLIRLAAHYNPRYGCFPGHRRLCKVLRCSERLLTHNLNLLARARLLTITVTGRGNLYELKFDSEFATECKSDVGDSSKGLLPPPAKSCGVEGSDSSKILRHSIGGKLKRTGKRKRAKPTEGNYEENSDVENRLEHLREAAEHVRSLDEIKAALDKRHSGQRRPTDTQVGKAWVDLIRLFKPESDRKIYPTKLDYAEFGVAYRRVGDPMLEAMQFAVEHWEDFVQLVRHEAGITKAPAEPTHRFFLRHLDVAVERVRKSKPQAKDPELGHSGFVFATEEQINLTNKALMQNTGGVDVDPE